MTEINCPNCGHHIETKAKLSGRRRQLPSYVASDIPGEVVENLRILRQLELDDPIVVGHTARLNFYLLNLKAAGHTLQSLGVVLGVSRERIRQRVAKAYPVDDTPCVPMPPAPEPPVLGPPAPKHPITTTAENRELLALRESATQVRGWTPADSPLRSASERLSALLNEYWQRGVPMAYLARVIGVSPRAVYLRLSQHGYRTLPPSQRHYQGGPGKKGTA